MKSNLKLTGEGLIMTFEFYDGILLLIATGGGMVSLLYFKLSLIYLMYRYAKGDDMPPIAEEFDLPIPILLKNLNPFYYKHIVYCIITSLFIILVSLLVAITWPVILPIAIIGYFIQRTRKINLEKKKMWGILKE